MENIESLTLYIPNSISKRLNNIHCIFTIQYGKD